MLGALDELGVLALIGHHFDEGLSTNDALVLKWEFLTLFDVRFLQDLDPLRVHIKIRVDQNFNFGGVLDKIFDLDIVKAEIAFTWLLHSRVNVV